MSSRLDENIISLHGRLATANDNPPREIPDDDYVPVLRDPDDDARDRAFICRQEDCA